MQPELIALVLAAAFLHACWGVAGSASRDPVMVAAIGALLPALIAAALILRGVTAPAAAAWPWIAGSIALHLGYLAMLLLAWRFAALTQLYPAARAAAIAAAAASAVIGLGVAAGQLWIAGIGVIAIGVFALTLDRRVAEQRRLAAIGLALIAGALLGCATAADFVGLHRADATLGYIAWIMLLEAPVVIAGALILRRGRLAALPWRELPWQSLGGLAAGASYAMMLWALSLAPLAHVAALRETQAVFAALIAAALLGDRLGGRGIAACIFAALGVVLLSVG